MKNEAKIEVTVKKVNDIINIEGTCNGDNDLIVRGIASTINTLVTKMVKDKNDPDEYVKTLEIFMKKLDKEVVDCKLQSIVEDFFKDLFNALNKDEEEDD